MGRVKILRASAGSGKTYRLAYEYIKAVVIQPRSYASILAVTFTNKATEEMKSRILSELNGLTKGESAYMADLVEQTGLDEDSIKRNAAKAQSLILHDYSHFAISTIDKFFQKIIRGFIKELGLDFGYAVELNNDGYIGEAVDRLIERTVTDPTVAMLINKAQNRKLEDGKNWDLRPELTSIAREVTSEKYQPSDKRAEDIIAYYEALSEVIEQKKAILAAECDKVLRLMERHGLQPTDFKGGQNSFAKSFVKLAGGDVIKNIEKLHKAADSAEEWYTKTSVRKDDIMAVIPELMELTRNITEQYDEFEKDKNSFDLLSENFYKNLLLGYIHDELNRLWAERNRLPIHQTTKLIGSLVENTAVPFIYEKAGNRFDRYMIDEFQDTSTGQWRNFLPLLDDAIASSDQQPVMLIGDVKQAIYRWRGGDWDILARAAVDHYADEADHDEQLRTNWRSLPEVVDFNNRLIRAVVEAAESSVLSQVYDDFQQTAPPHKKGGYVKVAEIDQEMLEQTILETVAGAISRGYRQKDIAILVRTAKNGREAADILLRGGYSIIDQESLQLARSEVVGIIISLLKHSLEREDTVSLAKYNRLTGREFNAQYEDSEFLDSLLLKTPIEALDSIITKLNLGRRADQVSYLQAFYQGVMNYCSDNIPDLRNFVEWWDENGDKKSVYLPSTGDAITILTIHKSKGLQYPCVIIPNCDWEHIPTRLRSTIWAETDEVNFAPFNPVPVEYKKTMEQSHYLKDYKHEKEYSVVDAVNMLYVAVTRAERELYVYYSSKESYKISSLIEKAGFANTEFGQNEVYHPKTEEPTEQIFFDRFVIESSAQKIRTSWDTQRYYEDGQKIETPISKGVLMHKLFSEIRTAEDIEQVIKGMMISGEMSEKTGDEIRIKVEKSLRNPLISSWFSSEWKYYNENAILLPDTTQTKRPDRVITQGEKAVVIDYKFGEKQKNSYISQVKSYKELLSEMGYKDVKGYIWYIELDDIITV